MDSLKYKRTTARFFALFTLICLYPVALVTASQFNSLLDQAIAIESRGEIPAAIEIYNRAASMQSNNPAGLCVLSKRYCNLTYLTDSVTIQKKALSEALKCASMAVSQNASNAEAHASLAVCYARSCAFADVKTQLEYSRLFKQEAEKAVALNPKEDIAYYLLGRWNYEIARVGFFSRAYVKLIYGDLPKASYQDAINNFQKAISLAPDRIIHHEGLAMAYQAAGKKDLAIKELNKCAELKPSDVADRQSQREALKRLKALEQ